LSDSLSRREAIALFGGLIVLPLAPAASRAGAGGASSYAPPASPRVTYNFNSGWRFLRGDTPGAEAPAFDDSAWSEVGLPHTYNDIDSFDEIISKGGEHNEYTGIAWYRKRFRLPPGSAAGKGFLELEGLKQAAHFYLNGTLIGAYENGVTACGLDLSAALLSGDRENVLSVKVDNTQHYVETATQTAFEWMSRDFDPNYGGLNHNVRLHVTGPVYQTLPLYENLGTTGVYVYAKNLSPASGTADIFVESQVRNESAGPARVALSAVVVDAQGAARATLTSAPVELAAGETRVLTVTGPMANIALWDDRNPNLYRVFTILHNAGGDTLDVCRTDTGFRKTEFRGGSGVGGVYVNDRFTYLKGYAQRSTNEWAGLGQAYPDWMHDYSARLIRASNANYVRWMHITPQPADVRACDRAGIIQICPAGDKEKDATGRQWEQRVAVMRASMIYLRNHPSILFYEAGNNGISAPHMQEMHDLRLQWDPHGGRAIGCRSLADEAAVPIAEYYGTMVTMDPRLDQPRPYAGAFRGYSDERRDHAPLIEAEDFRDEAARRFWDDYSPPTFGFHKKPEDTYNLNSETFCLAAINRYNAYASQMISNPDPKRSKWSGYASIIFADSNSHGRQYGSEVCRVSGKVDAVRLPKQAYFVYRVMQNPRPDIHLIGHWNYPAGTKKTVYVASNCPAVELFVNGKSAGVHRKPADGYLFAFPGLAWVPGSLRAVGIPATGAHCEHTLTTAGPPARIALTAITGPGGLQADGSDVALVDVEVVDALGRRCPIDEARIDFKLTGAAIWRGGYNSGIPGSTNRTFLNTECGINRVAIRSTSTPGDIMLTATRTGLPPAHVTLTAKPVAVAAGLRAIT
jgi:beta-galactosidase